MTVVLCSSVGGFQQMLSGTGFEDGSCSGQANCVAGGVPRNFNQEKRLAGTHATGYDTPARPHSCQEST
jgi:hypothetical protein